MSERVLRSYLFIAMLMVSCCWSTSDLPFALYYIGDVSEAMSPDSPYFASSVANLLWFALYLLSVPILGVLQLSVLAKPAWKKFYRVVLPFLFIMVWWGTLVRLSDWGSVAFELTYFRNVYFWIGGICFVDSPLVVTAAGIVEIILIKRERRKPSEDLG